MKATNKQKRDGRYAWADDPEIADGESVKVPVMLCDAKPRVRWVRPLTDSEAALHRAGSRTFDQLTDQAGSDPRLPAIDAREAWVKSLGDQWRMPVASPNAMGGLSTGPHRPSVRDAVSLGPGPAATLPPSEEDPQAERDAAWSRYRDQLGNAWRNPGPGPSWVGPGA
jgi:hypothetical protein